MFSMRLLAYAGEENQIVLFTQESFPYTGKTFTIDTSANPESMPYIQSVEFGRATA